MTPQQQREAVNRMKPEEALQSPSVQETVRTGQTATLPHLVQEAVRRRVEEMEARRREREQEHQRQRQR